MDGSEFAHDKRIEADGAVTVFHPRGVLSGRPECYAWLESIRRDVGEGRKRLVLNLQDVSRIDSTGVGLIAAIHVSVMNIGGVVCLTGLSDRTRRLLETTFLLRVVPSAADEAEAIRRAAADA